MGKAAAFLAALAVMGWMNLSCGVSAARETPSPLQQQILAAQRSVRENPADPDAVCELGVLYYRNGEYRKAIPLLEKVLQQIPGQTRALCYLGLCQEKLGKTDLALATYLHYVSVPESDPLRSWLEGRSLYIDRVRRKESALGRFNRRADLDSAAIYPHRFVLTPLSYYGEDPQYAHLGRGILAYLLLALPQCAHIVPEDFGKVRTVFQELDKRPELLANEQNSTILLGKIFNAGRVVRGGYTVVDGQIVLDLSVWEVESGEIPRARTFTDSLSRIFALQFRLADQLRKKAGPPCDIPANLPFTRKLSAYLAFSAGLAAQDRGDFADARQFFEKALKEDPQFDLCRELMTRAQLLTIARADPDRVRVEN